MVPRVIIDNKDGRLIDRILDEPRARNASEDL